MAEGGVLPVKIDKAVEYAVHDGVRLVGDLYRPAAAGAHPVLIAIHGGGWRRGAAEMYQYWGPWLASRGIALYTIEYRLTEGERHRYPAAAQDVRAAVQFLRGNAAHFGCDGARIGLIGDSAGAHLGALVALAGDAPSLAAARGPSPHAGISAVVKVVVGVYGVYDMLAQWQHDLATRPREQITEIFLGVGALEDKFRYFEASPIAYATTKAPKTAFFVAWGSGDDIVDGATQSAAFVTALKQAGIFVRTLILPGAPHFWMTDPIDEPGSFAGFLAPKLLRFLNEQL